MKTLKEILQNQKEVYVIDSTIDYTDYIPLDLSASYTDELDLDLTDAKKFEEFVENLLSKNNAEVAFSGYLEKRNRKNGRTGH